MSTSSATLRARPDPRRVGQRAAEILDQIKATPEYERLTTSALKYVDCWATFTGYPLIDRFDLATDAQPLTVEALRVLALKTAVYELSGGDEAAAELLVSAPVDEMVHAVLAQYTLCQDLTARLGIRFVHMTDLETFGWHGGDYTSHCYSEAGWGDMPTRYWIDAGETGRRLRILGQTYATIGIMDLGRRHTIDFRENELVPA